MNDTTSLYLLASATSDPGSVPANTSIIVESLEPLLLPNLSLARVLTGSSASWSVTNIQAGAQFTRAPSPKSLFFLRPHFHATNRNRQWHIRNVIRNHWRYIHFASCHMPTVLINDAFTNTDNPLITITLRTAWRQVLCTIMKRASRALVTTVMERASRVLTIADTFSGIKGISPPQLHLLSQASDPAESNLASVLTHTSIVAESTGSMTQLPSDEWPSYHPMKAWLVSKKEENWGVDGFGRKSFFFFSFWKEFQFHSGGEGEVSGPVLLFV